MTGNLISITVPGWHASDVMLAAPTKSGGGNVLAMFVAMVTITLVVFIWAAFFRKPPRRRHSHHRHQHRDSSTTSSASRSLSLAERGRLTVVRPIRRASGKSPGSTPSRRR